MEKEQRLVIYPYIIHNTGVEKSSFYISTFTLNLSVVKQLILYILT